jgi:hypothetical protein
MDTEAWNVVVVVVEMRGLDVLALDAPASQTQEVLLTREKRMVEEQETSSLYVSQLECKTSATIVSGFPSETFHFWVKCSIWKRLITTH